MVRSPGHLFAYVVYSLFGARGATATRHGLDALYLLAYRLVPNGVGREHEPVVAGVGMAVLAAGRPEHERVAGC
jgi:hypothetical protein